LDVLIQQRIPFEKLSDMLIAQLKEKGYTPGTIHCIEIELDHMSSYEIVMIVIASVTLVLALIEATKGNRK
jgi:hypothetical protein